MAVAQGKSLKNFIETVLISKANTVAVEVSENPSPSGDPWFNDPENIASVKRGMEDIKAGRCRAYSMDEIRGIVRRMTYELILSDEAAEHMIEWRKSGQKKNTKED